MGGAVQKCLGSPANETMSRDLPAGLIAPPDEPPVAFPVNPTAAPPPAVPVHQNGNMADKTGVNGAPAPETLTRVSSVHEGPGLQQPVFTATSIVHKPPPIEEAGPWENVRLFLQC